MLAFAFTAVAIVNMIIAVLSACYGPSRPAFLWIAPATVGSIVAWLAWFLAGGWSPQRVLYALLCALVWTPFLLAAGWLFRTYPGGGLIAYIQAVLSEKFHRD